MMQAIDYGLIAAGIAVAIIGVLFVFGGDVETYFVKETTIECWLTDTKVIRFQTHRWSMNAKGTYGTLMDGRKFSYSPSTKCYAVDLNTDKEELD